MRGLPKTFHLSQAIALLYAGMAIATIAAPNMTIRWMLNSYGVHADAFVVLLALATAILLTKPSTGWFVACMLPLAFYMFMSVSATSAQNSPLVTVSAVYAFIIVSFPLAYKLCSADGIQLHHVFGIAIAVMAMAMLSSLPAAALEFIESAYGIITVSTVVVLLISATLLLLFPSVRLLTVLIALIMLYSSSAAVISVQRGNPIGFFINMILFVTVFYTLIKRRRYFHPVKPDER